MNQQSGLDVELSILAEARNEVGAADHKASMVLAVLGIGFGALLAGLIAQDWSPSDLNVFGRVAWGAGALLALGSVVSAGCAVWPRFTVPSKPSEIFYWGQVAAFVSQDELNVALDKNSPTLEGRTRHQLFELSRIVATKYKLVRLAMKLAAMSFPFFLIASVTGYS